MITTRPARVAMERNLWPAPRSGRSGADGGYRQKLHLPPRPQPFAVSSGRLHPPHRSLDFELPQPTDHCFHMGLCSEGVCSYANMRRARVHDTAIIQITEQNDLAMFKRYNLVDEKDTAQAADKLTSYLMP